MTEITIHNIEEANTEELRKQIFGMIDLHVDYLSLEKDKFVYLLGYYPAIYNYVSELYTYLIGRVRTLTDAGNKFKAARIRDKRDIMEEALKSIKLQYESISRKITILAPDEGRS